MFNVWFNHCGRAKGRTQFGNECIPCRRRIYLKYKLVNSIDRRRSKKKCKSKNESDARWTEDRLRSTITSVIQRIWINCWRSDLLQTKLPKTFPFSFGSIHAYYMQSNCHQRYIADIIQYENHCIKWCNSINSNV